jgi:invasion protein IalB
MRAAERAIVLKKSASSITRGTIEMPFATRFARRYGIAVAGLVGAGLLAAAPTLAQQRQQRPAAQPAQPAPQPAQPAPQPAPAPQGAQQAPAGPILVQLKSEPSQPDWTKVCGKDQAQVEVCYTTRDFISEQGQPVVAVAVYEVKNQQNPKAVRFMVPPGLLLQPGVRFAIDQGQAVPGRYSICLPNGCFAEAAQVTNDTISQMKKGGTLNLSVQNSAMREITFAVPLVGFGKAFDGPPIDPEVLRKQQEELQKELERRSDDMRKRLEQAGTSGTAAPAGAAPAATAPRAAAPNGAGNARAATPATAPAPRR